MKWWDQMPWSLFFECWVLNRTDWFQLGKGVHQGCILSPCLFNLYAEYIMKTLGWKKHRLQSRLQGEISIASDVQMTPPYCRNWRRIKNLLMKVKEESEKVGLKVITHTFTPRFIMSDVQLVFSSPIFPKLSQLFFTNCWFVQSRI